MDSRHKVIGQNSSGKESEEENRTDNAKMEEDNLKEQFALNLQRNELSKKRKSDERREHDFIASKHKKKMKILHSRQNRTNVTEMSRNEIDKSVKNSNKNVNNLTLGNASKTENESSSIIKDLQADEPGIPLTTTSKLHKNKKSGVLGKECIKTVDENVYVEKQENVIAKTKILNSKKGVDKSTQTIGKKRSSKYKTKKKGVDKSTQTIRKKFNNQNKKNHVSSKKIINNSQANTIQSYFVPMQDNSAKETIKNVDIKQPAIIQVDNNFIMFKSKEQKRKMNVIRSTKNVKSSSESNTKMDSIEMNVLVKNKRKWTMKLRTPVHKEVSFKKEKSENNLDKPQDLYNMKVSAESKNSHFKDIHQEFTSYNKADKVYLETKKIVKITKNNNLYEKLEYLNFSPGSHFKAEFPEIIYPYCHLPTKLIPLKKIDGYKLPLVHNVEEMKSLISFTKQSVLSNLSFNRITVFKKILKQLKNDDPNYPFYKAFKSTYQKHQSSLELYKNNKIEDKMDKEEHKNKFKTDGVVERSSGYLIWPEKYKPNKSSELFSNYSKVMALKKWLQDWLTFSSEASAKTNKRNRNNSSSGSEFETEYADGNHDILLKNVLIVVGPHGSGKTSSVYALCNELGINIVELNASSKRTGKRLMRKIQEATLSHQVHKTGSRTVSSFFEKINSSNSCLQLEENTSQKSKMSLLLIEDVDLVFEQDEGFIAALTQILHTSKRPVIITSADSSSCHVQKFAEKYPVIPFASIPSKNLSGWLQMVCLSEGAFVEKESISDLLELNNGDARKTLLELQFWIISGGNLTDIKSVDKPPSDENKSEEMSKSELVEDFMFNESSNDSLLEIDQKNDIFNYEIHSNCADAFDKNESSIRCDRLWWNLYNMIDTTGGNRKLVLLMNFLESMSFINGSLEQKSIENDRQLTTNLWNRKVKNSLSLNYSLEGYEFHKDLMIDMTEAVLEGSFRNFIKNRDDLKIKKVVPTPDAIKRRIEMHSLDESLLKVVPLSTQIDKKSVALDYLPMLRNIARIENFRKNSNSKRNKRFYHYLRGLGLDTKLTIRVSELLEKH